MFRLFWCLHIVRTGNERFDFKPVLVLAMILLFIV